MLFWDHDSNSYFLTSFLADDAPTTKNQTERYVFQPRLFVKYELRADRDLVCFERLITMICQLENPDGRNALSGAMPHCSGDDGKLTANNKHTCQLMFLFMIVDERTNMVSGDGGRNFCPYVHACG